VPAQDFDLDPVGLKRLHRVTPGAKVPRLQPAFTV